MLTEIFKNWISIHKALGFWFHSAHHTVKGNSFIADHSILFNDTYTWFDDNFDGLVERGIGLTEDHTLADPIIFVLSAFNHLQLWKPAYEMSTEQLVVEGKEHLEYYLEYLEQMRFTLKKENLLSTGLDDMTATLCNDIESKLYLYNQRSKY